MDRFLTHVAADLIEKYGTNLSKVAVVFPNKRAALFLNEELAQQSQRPIWSPHYFTISELFKQYSNRQVADQIKLVCDLYKVYLSVTGSDETLDKFYSWGEMLLSDFDDIDKNNVQADRLFLNLEEIHDFDSFDFLTDEERVILEQFFYNIKFDEKTELKERFKRMWKDLYTIYATFNELLNKQGIAYEGALYREVVEDKSWEPHYVSYIFIGFNVLNKVETKLFQRLQKAGCAHFYWDYDRYYVSQNKFEAGEFIRRNLSLFPNELSNNSEILYNNLQKKKDISFIAATTEAVQANYLNRWVKDNITEKENETAVVLCNENLLETVLHSLPEDAAEHINVTTGYPLTQTSVANFVKLFLYLQNDGYSERNKHFFFQQILQVLDHPYTRLISSEVQHLQDFIIKEHRYYPKTEELQLDEPLKLIFTRYKDNKSMVEALMHLMEIIAQVYKNKEVNNKNQLHEESVFRSFTLLQRLHLLIEQGDLTVNRRTFTNLFSQLLDATSIPFHGEPAVGLQVMGVLETRNLDFRHLIMLSVNEGMLPKANNFSSFIPYNLRKAFGLTTIEYKESVFAYYFYRLLQRSEKTTLLYNTGTDGMNKGEMSRFMMQYQIESGQNIKHYYLQSQQDITISQPFSIKKTPEMLHHLQQIYEVKGGGRILSPTALNSYLDCPMRFYFRYVLGLKTPDNDALNVDSPTFGSVFHLVAELIYKQLKNQQDIVEPDKIKMVLNEKNDLLLKKLVDKAYAKEVFLLNNWETADVSKLYNGLQLISRNAVIEYVKLLLKIDYKIAPFKILGLEEKTSQTFKVGNNGHPFEVKIGGIIDRLDQITVDGKEIIRVIDYKTSKKEQSADSIESLFLPDNKRSGYFFQTLLYSSIIRMKTEKEVAPALLYIQKGAKKDFDPVLSIGFPRKKVRIDDIAVYVDELFDYLSDTLNAIFDPKIDFTQTEIKDHCIYCPFAALCKTSIKN